MASTLDRSSGEPLVRDISDTARWVAYYRAQETDRPDALFKDPYARALAGARGEAIARPQKLIDTHAWSFLARTLLFDRFVTQAVRSGADLVVNLAAGLDTRPYRMDLPKTLRWIEIDLPGILDYKEGILAGATPVCALERWRVDLADEEARLQAFARASAGATRAVVLTEGLIIYLDPAQVASLARALAATPPFTTWITDLASPGLLKMMSAQAGQMVAAAGAPFKFAPVEGPEYFVPLRWTAVMVESVMKTAGRLNRLPLMLKLCSKFPEPRRRPPNRPWSAVIQLERGAT